MLGAVALSVGGITTAASAMLCAPLVCNIGTRLAGGCSDPMTATSGGPIVYNIWAIDKDQPQVGGPEVPDTTTFASDMLQDTMAPGITIQGDDPPTGKRTFTVSGTAPIVNAVMVIEDSYRFDDLNYDEHSDPRFQYGDDPKSGWYTKTITVNPAPGG